MRTYLAGEQHRPDPDGASTEVDREDWGLTGNAALEKGGVLVSKKIKLELEVEAARRAG